MQHRHSKLLTTAGGAALLVLFLFTTAANAEDLVFSGIYEYSIDLPRTLFLLKRNPADPPMEVQGNFELNWAFLDTGASGIVMSRETVDLFELDLAPGAKYVDVGVGGEEEFWVTEPLYIGTCDFEAADPYDPCIYNLDGTFRFQVTQDYAEWPNEPLDILGIPVMAGHTVIFHPGATNDLEYFSTRVVEHDDPTIPPVDFQVPLRFERFITPDNSGNIPPLPVLAYNPVIDNVTATYDGTTVTGTWLLDSGASISMISVELGQTLGLVDALGDPLITPLITLPIGGIGAEVLIPVFEMDHIHIPTLNGYDLVFENARLGVHDIGVYDERKDEYIILDGIFGSNFLCMSAELDPVTYWPNDLAYTPFNYVVFDTRNALLGFDVFDEYPLPQSTNTSCGAAANPWPLGDITRDCIVDINDFIIYVDEWLNGCDWLNWNCRGADFNNDGSSNIADIFQLTLD